MEQQRSTSRPSENAEDEQPRNHSRTGPRRDGDRLGEHERSIWGSGFRSRQEPLREHGQQQRRRALGAQGQHETRPHEPNGAATATHATERSVSTTARDPDATEIGSVSTSGASGERIPVAPRTPSGAWPAATAARSSRTRTARDEAPRTKQRSNGDAPNEPLGEQLRISPRPHGERPGEHERASGDADSDRDRNPFGGSAKSNGSALSGAQGEHETRRPRTKRWSNGDGPDGALGEHRGARPRCDGKPSVSAGGSSGMRIPIASGSASGPPLRSWFSTPIVTISDYRKTAQAGWLETVGQRTSLDGWRPNGGRGTVVQRSCAENRRGPVRAQRPERARELHVMLGVDPDRVERAPSGVEPGDGIGITGNPPRKTEVLGQTTPFGA